MTNVMDLQVSTHNYERYQIQCHVFEKFNVWIQTYVLVYVCARAPVLNALLMVLYEAMTLLLIKYQELFAIDVRVRRIVFSFFNVTFFRPHGKRYHI